MNKEYREEKNGRIMSRIKLSVYEVKRQVSQLLFGKIKSKTQLKAKTKETMFVWAMLAPSLISFVIFWVYVNFDSLMMAFQSIDYSAGGEEYWTLQNFKDIYEMFTEGKWGIDLKRCLSNTMKYWGLGMVMSIPHSFFLTYLFQKKVVGSKFFRVVLYLPSLISGVVVAAVFESFVSYKGVVGYLAKELFDTTVPAWFQEEIYATKMLLFFGFFFGFAGNYIIFSGAMGRISRELTEAAYMDGVTMWQEIWYIIIPQMWPTIGMTILGSFTGILGASGNILLFTPNMPSTYTFSYFIYDQIRVYNSYYLPAALGWLMTILTLPLCIIVRKIVDSFYQDVE